ncbi:hypothetical protein VaNZ11_012401 [Volvox africanus]|uniref:AB hydrolase-1 domain-containing protein n=1 Tax=Volvox africanus TaxID=51714 RepID=A0ABQ5SDS3_9CHLO|nr:hypothetical protein VaNZ11_012401 [Volvox africanus]
MPPWRWKPQGAKRSAELPYANGLPKYYNFRLSARIILVCAMATASTSAIIIAYSFFSPILMLVPWAYLTSEVVFVAISWRRWRCFSSMKHEAERESLRAAAVAASYTDTAAAAASARFEAVASALARGGPTEVESFLGLWFHGRPVAEIGRGNLKDLLAYAFFFAEDSSIVIAQGHEALLESMVDRLETLLCPADLNDACPKPARTGSVNGFDPVQHPEIAQHKRKPGARPASGRPEDAPIASVAEAFSAAAAATPAEAPRGRRLSPGTTPGLRFMAHMTDPIPHFYRPLAMYVAMEAMAWINHCMLAAAGFRRMALLPAQVPPSRSVLGGGASGSGDGSDGVAAGSQEHNEGVHHSDHYYYIANMPAVDSSSNHSGSGDNKMVPIVFLHGVGLGLIPYLRLLVALAATGAPIIAFELKHVSQRWTRGHPPSMRQLAEDVVIALQRQGFSQAALLAHSFGTAVASVLMQARPEVVRHVVMLDPICFNMYMPRLLRNFLYRRIGTAAAGAAGGAATTATIPSSGVASPPRQLPPPKTRLVSESSAGSSNSLFGIVVAILRCIAGVTLDLLMLGPARELHCTSLLCRRVVWSEINLWEHMVPEHCTVVLSGRDDLMCPRSLERWLRENTSATVIVHPELMHAQICMAWTRQDELLHRMLQVVYGGNHGGSTCSPSEVVGNAAAVVSVASACERAVIVDCSESPTACSKLDSKEVQQERHDEHWRQLSPGDNETESEVGWRNPASWRSGDSLHINAVAEGDADSDSELLSIIRGCGSSHGRRRGMSLDSPSGYWGGGNPWRRRLCRDPGRQQLGEKESADSGTEEGAFTAAAPQRPLRRLSVERHDSAGSYIRLPSSGTLQNGGTEGEVGTA